METVLLPRPGPPPAACSGMIVEFHKYAIMENFGLRSPAEPARFAGNRVIVGE